MKEKSCRRSKASGSIAAFKAARKLAPSVRYADYLDARKAAMIEVLARDAYAPCSMNFCSPFIL
jgi:hypothetical protein